MSERHNSYNKISESDNKNADTRPFLRRAMDGFGNIFALNICFVISSLPIITIGASLAALYSMCIRLQDGREETVLAGYITEFKKNFKQATKAYLAILVYLAVMLAEYIMINNIEGGISTFYTYVLLVEVVFFCLVVPFVFPLIACYENTLFNTFKNSFILAIGYLGSWIKIFIAWFAPIAFCVIYPTLFLYLWYMWLLFIFGAIAYGTSFTVRKVFNKNKELEEYTEKKAEEEAREAKKQAAKEAKEARKKSEEAEESEEAEVPEEVEELEEPKADEDDKRETSKSDNKKKSGDSKKNKKSK